MVVDLIREIFLKLFKRGQPTPRVKRESPYEEVFLSETFDDRPAGPHVPSDIDKNALETIILPRRTPKKETPAVGTAWDDLEHSTTIDDMKALRKKGPAPPQHEDLDKTILVSRRTPKREPPALSPEKADLERTIFSADMPTPGKERPGSPGPQDIDGTIDIPFIPEEKASPAPPPKETDWERTTIIVDPDLPEKKGIPFSRGLDIHQDDTITGTPEGPDNEKDLMAETIIAPAIDKKKK